MIDALFDLTPLQELADWYFLFYTAIALAIFWIAKHLNARFSGYSLDKQLTHFDNKAVATSFTGFLFALGIIIHGVITSPISQRVGGADSWLARLNNPALADLLDTATWATLGCLLLLLSRVINDKFILPSFSNKKELIEDKNVGVGAVQASAYIATALIISATLGGEETSSFGGELLFAALWFLISQTLLILFAKIYQLITKYDFHVELEADNTAVGVSLGGTLIAFGILLSLYLQQYNSLLGLFIWAIFISILIFLNRLFVDKFILPKENLDREISEDRNWGVAAIEAATAIAIALIISGSAL